MAHARAADGTVSDLTDAWPYARLVFVGAVVAVFFVFFYMTEPRQQGGGRHVHEDRESVRGAHGPGGEKQRYSRCASTDGGSTYSKKVYYIIGGWRETRCLFIFSFPENQWSLARSREL